jgi:hypothetical protein
MLPPLLSNLSKTNEDKKKGRNIKQQKDHPGLSTSLNAQDDFFSPYSTCNTCKAMSLNSFWIRGAEE